MNALVAQPLTNADVYRASTDAAGLCRDIVMKTAMTIQNRKYVKVEGWQAIAIAHGCTGSARDVERVDGGVRAMGEIRRMSDGALIATAEGFVGEDEATWYGGEVIAYGKKKTLPKRPDYAIRAMAQTRAISRACRSAFAHVVVLIDSNLSTTPAEEVPDGGFNDYPATEPRDVTPRQERAPERPAIQVTAEAGIIMCETVEACDEWKVKNTPLLDSIEDDNVYNAIVRFWKAHRASLLPLHPNARPAREVSAEEVFA